MKITVIGCGNAFSNRNYNQCLLLSEDGRNMLVDCGFQTGAALHSAKVPLKSITDVYISHLHADHIGFLEGLGFQRYDWLNKPASAKEEWHHGYRKPALLSPEQSYAPILHANEGMMHELWEHSLKGGMKCIEGLDATLDTFFYTDPIKPGDFFMWGQWKCEPVQQIHIMAGSYISNTFGLFMTHVATKKKVYFTTDAQHCSPRQVEIFYRNADIIFQDCECIGMDMALKQVKFMSGVHANYAQLAGWDEANSPKLAADIKAKMWLSHYQDFVSDKRDMFGNPMDWDTLAANDGFKGFVKVGQEIEI